ncbi:hypothetical protein [Janthinobacterium sp. 17J80-10]|uniref:hypothetical protein n=1 Tax=Janthinobacterium sp. 17J80-10 TaxID=2497863 RepID=UPI0010057AB4|nr:hypothetical protein [Janthinobacterium sp. 17J80-10]QAU35251.1 hypothetical protein EKL02_14275 [Janthinobacterium sp. 17J80-10]
MANKFFWLLATILPVTAVAQQQLQAAQPNYLDEMAKVDAQIAYVQKQTELREALRRSSGNEGLPKVLSIMVDERGGAAQVVYASGIVRWLRKGDFLQDGIRVQSIDKSSVVAGGNGGKFRLSYFSPHAGGSAAAATDPVSAPPRLNIPLPPLPVATHAPANVQPPNLASSAPLPTAVSAVK